MYPVIKWFVGLCKRQHVHRWKDYRYNGFGICIEQRCTCGLHRHHFLMDTKFNADGSTTTRWRDGKHPSRTQKLNYVPPTS